MPRHLRSAAASALASALAGLALLGAAATAPSRASGLSSLPNTPASHELDWVVAELNRDATPSAALLAQHFSSAFLKAVPPAQLVDALAPVAADRPLVLNRVLSSPGELTLAAELTGKAGVAFKVSIVLSATAPRLINGLLFQLLASPINSWSGIDAALRRLAPQASMYAGYADGSPLHELNASTAGAIGSAFKLYVLGALAQAIAQESVKWTTPLAINNSWKSLPSGNMRLDPAGRTFTLLYYAQQMISVSDNTAADHLIHRLGRAAVTAQLAALRNHSAGRNEPFLTTREMFALKLAAPRSLLDAFASAGTAQRERLLARVDELTPTLAEESAWTAPRDINRIEWFASPLDLAHAISILVADSHHAGLAPLSQILAINPGVSLSHKTWPYVGYKGGSEPGVISTTWYLRRRDGRAFVLSIVLNDPKQNISTIGEVEVAEAAINLLARS